MRFGSWRQFVVEVLLGASAVALGFAAIDPMAEPILAAVVLVGVALLVELDVTAQPARDIRPQSLRASKESESAPPEPQATAGFDAAIVDATSV
jgi:hypothetical protein